MIVYLFLIELRIYTCIKINFRNRILNYLSNEFLITMIETKQKKLDWIQFQIQNDKYETMDQSYLLI